MFCEALEFVMVSLPCFYSGDLSLPFSSNKQGCSYRDWRLCVGFDHSIDSLYFGRSCASSCAIPSANDVAEFSGLLTKRTQ
jgi:hypothetical protein